MIIVRRQEARIFRAERFKKTPGAPCGLFYVFAVPAVQRFPVQRGVKVCYKHACAYEKRRKYKARRHCAEEYSRQYHYACKQSARPKRNEILLKLPCFYFCLGCRLPLQHVFVRYGKPVYGPYCRVYRPECGIRKHRKLHNAVKQRRTRLLHSPAHVKLVQSCRYKSFYKPYKLPHSAAAKRQQRKRRIKPAVGVRHQHKAYQRRNRHKA